MLLQDQAPAQWRGSPGNFAFVAVFCEASQVTGHGLSPVPDLGAGLIQEMLDRARKPGLPALAGVPHWTERSVTQSCTLTGTSWLQLGAGASPATAYVRNQKVIKNSHRQVTQLRAVCEALHSSRCSSSGSVLLVIFPNPVNLWEMGEGHLLWLDFHLLNLKRMISLPSALAWMSSERCVSDHHLSWQAFCWNSAWRGKKRVINFVPLLMVWVMQSSGLDWFWLLNIKVNKSVNVWTLLPLRMLL